MSVNDDKDQKCDDSVLTNYEFPIEAEGKSTILIIECRKYDNETVNAVQSAYENNTFDREYEFLFFRWPDVGESLGEFENWLNLKAEKIGLEKDEGCESEAQIKEHNIKLSKLKAIIIGWDSGKYGLKVIKKIRHYYPNLPVFIVNYGKIRNQDYSDSLDDKSSDSRHCGEESDNNISYGSSLQIKLYDFVSKEKLGGSPIVFEGRDMLGNESETLLKKIDTIISNYREAPYWEALKEYAKKPVISFHALPVGHKRSTSNSIADFAEHYGPGYFSAETSLAADPLDSLLDPKGPLQNAQEKAAIAFGAQAGHTQIIKTLSVMEKKQSPLRGTRFVTNGTSTANKIVHEAFVRAKNYVLIDRNCHISHHYAMAYCDAHPVYLEPFKNKDGIWGPVLLKTIVREFDRLAGIGKLPSAIVLTNPTFDGLYYRPEKVIDAVIKVLTKIFNNKKSYKKFDELCSYINDIHPLHRKVSSKSDQAIFLKTALECIVFLFDEAWSAFAYFHPMYIKYTAMKAALVLDQNLDAKWSQSVRIYSTQSTHKSLSAFRQGSMIHFRDPLFKHQQVSMQFEQAYRAHTTTSANASILASLDVARRQAQLEGTQLVDTAIRLANDFRDSVKKELGSHFRVIETNEMLEDEKNKSLDNKCYFADPTRVTILPIGKLSGICGEKLKKLLLTKDIQINKYENNSVLAIFNIGVTESSKNVLIRALKSIAHELDLVSYEQKFDSGKQSKGIILNKSRLDDEQTLGYWLKNRGKHDLEYCVIDKNKVTKSRPKRGYKYIVADFIVPYPPGYPLLVPGQVINNTDVKTLSEITITEIHGAIEEKDIIKIPVYNKKVKKRKK